MYSDQEGMVGVGYPRSTHTGAGWPVPLACPNLTADDNHKENTMPVTTIKDASKPRGPVPLGIREWLELNPDDWFLAVCECGKWYHSMDRFAPYHTETNWCKTCGFERKELNERHNN